MKKALLIVAAVATCASVFAQSTDGTIVFKNRNILTSNPDPTSAGYIPGGNGNGSYNVPIWEQGGAATQNGAGDLPGGVTVGLFTANGTTPLATSVLFNSGAGTMFFGTPTSSTVTVTGAAPGSTPTLIVRAWQGSGGFDAAKNGGLQYGEWSFTAPALGGVGSPPSTPPTMTGWGPQSGAGFELTSNSVTVPEPSTIALGVLGVGALFLRRRK